jgi:hypothetical protein
MINYIHDFGKLDRDNPAFLAFLGPAPRCPTLFEWQSACDRFPGCRQARRRRRFAFTLMWDRLWRLWKAGMN